MTNMINQETQKKTPVGSKIPDWYDPDYKNATTPKEQKELERLKKRTVRLNEKVVQKIRLLLTNKSLEQSYAIRTDCYLIIA